MIVDLFEDWNPERAELVRSDMGQDGYPAVDPEAAAQEAVEKLGIKDPRGPGYLIPLFAEDAPEPSDEYVVYRPEWGQFIWYDTETGHGDQRFTSCSKFQRHKIGHRLRFWLSVSELNLDDSELPDEQVSPSDPLTDAEQDAFFDDLRGFVQREMEAQRESRWEEYEDLRLKTAISRRNAAGPFVSIGRGETRDGVMAFHYQLVEDEESDSEPNLRDDESLFNDDVCILDSPDVSRGLPMEVKLEQVNDATLALVPRWETTDASGVVEKYLQEDGIDVYLYKLLNPVPFDRRLEAIGSVSRDEKKRGILTGTRSAHFTVNRFAAPEPEIELNEYQMRALVWADSADDFVLIHGPPGTGKTRTLTAYVRHAVEMGESVLVTAHSNQAVDNLLVGDSTVEEPEPDTLHSMAQDQEVDLSIARVGDNSRSRVVQRHYMGVSAKRADVVAATTSGAAQFDANEFDVAVVDEATQASRPSTAIALNCAEKLILAGDHKQLPPFTADEESQEQEIHISLFEYLLERYGDEARVLLGRQYRMNELIAEFPNREIYDNELETADRNRAWSIDDLSPLMGINVEGPERRQSVGRSYYNKAEADAVAKQVELLLRCDVEPADIGVISAYTGQIQPIRNRVNALDFPDTHQVAVDTVDSFQGGEREAIIVSFVRSNDGGHSGFLEFPDEGKRRLNVALTRARKRLVLVGDWETLGTAAPHRSAEESCAPLYARLAEHLRSVEQMLEG
jgi:hypothetical protein